MSPPSPPPHSESLNSTKDGLQARYAACIYCLSATSPGGDPPASSPIARQQLPVRLNPMRPQEVKSVEGMFASSWRGCSALTRERDRTGVRWRTLPNEVRYERKKSLPYSRSAQVAMRANNRCTTRLIFQRWLLEGCCEPRYSVVQELRLNTVLSQ